MTKLRKSKNNYELYLFNILDDQILKIDAEYKELEKLIEYLIDNKYNNKKNINNEIF